MRGASPSQPSTRNYQLAVLNAPSDVENCPAADVNGLATGRSICEQISLTGDRDESRAVQDRNTPQSEGLTSPLQIGATGSLRSAELDPKIGHFARENGVGYHCDQANVAGSIGISGEVLPRSGLSQREVLLGQVAARNGKVTWIHARARCHATGKYHGEPKWDYELHILSTPEQRKWCLQTASSKIFSLLFVMPRLIKGGRTFKILVGHPIRSRKCGSF
jgi:hypothetical protein